LVRSALDSLQKTLTDNKNGIHIGLMYLKMGELFYLQQTMTHHHEMFIKIGYDKIIVVAY